MVRAQLATAVSYKKGLSQLQSSRALSRIITLPITDRLIGLSRYKLTIKANPACMQVRHSRGSMRTILSSGQSLFVFLYLIATAKLHALEKLEGICS